MTTETKPDSLRSPQPLTPFEQLFDLYDQSVALAKKGPVPFKIRDYFLFFQLKICISVRLCEPGTFQSKLTGFVMSFRGSGDPCPKEELAGHYRLSPRGDTGLDLE